MKQCILIGLLIGLLTAAVPLKAQVAVRDTDARKGSRLELGRSATTRKTVVTAKPNRFRLLQASAPTNLDRPVALMKNQPLNEYYRSLLMTPRVAKTTAAGPAAETTATVSMAEARMAAEPELGDDDVLYSNDRIRVSNIYPNPASDFAEIDYKISGPVGDAKMVLLNVLGARVAEYGLEPGERKLRIATGDMATGYYLYQLSVDGKKVATKRLLVRHQ